MAIFIRIKDEYTERLLTDLRARQTTRVSMSALAEAMLIKAAEASSVDPEAWKRIGVVDDPLNTPLPTPRQV